MYLKILIKSIHYYFSDVQGSLLFRSTYFLEKVLQYIAASLNGRCGFHIPKINIFRSDYILSLKIGKFYIKRGSDYDYPLQPYVEESHEKYWNVKNGGIFLDIGGHVGTYSIKLLAAHTGEDIICYCFEPAKETFSVLEKNIELNNLGEKIFPQNLAIFSSIGKIAFTDYSPEDASVSKIVTNSTSGKTVEVDSITLDAWISENNIDIQNISLLKVDVEGFEYDVFLGMRKLLTENTHLGIICELLDEKSKNTIENYLEEFGFKIEQIDSNNYFFTAQNYKK